MVVYVIGNGQFWVYLGCLSQPGGCHGQKNHLFELNVNKCQAMPKGAILATK